MAAESVPVLVVTGFLGSGKTTLVNRILTTPGGARTAVVVNEFGDVPIDGQLVVAADEEVVELANGCICCTVRGDLALGLSGLLARRRRRLFRGEPFERIVIETSGLASPGPVIQTLLLEPELSEATFAAGVVTLAHAALVARQLTEHPEVEEQVGYADRLILNHADRASADELATVEAALRERNALAPIVRATRAEVDLADAFERAGGDERWAERAEANSAAPHAHSQGAATIVLRSRAPLDIHALKMWLQYLAANRSHDLWRMKGVLACRTLPNEVVVQSVHQFLELGPGAGPPPEESVLVVIGRDLDRPSLERGWRSAGGETEPPPA